MFDLPSVPSVLYGCCFVADLNLDNVTYVDIIPNLKKKKGTYICADIQSIDFSKFDIILCSPPCNYYSRANWRRDTSYYAQMTKHLLPYCINAAYRSGKPFLIENVRNKNLMYNLDIPKDVMIFEHGRHTYFTNVLFMGISNVPQVFDNINVTYSAKRQGGDNVNNVFKTFLSFLLQKDL